LFIYSLGPGTKRLAVQHRTSAKWKNYFDGKGFPVINMSGGNTLQDLS